ncbi:hypothetical protein IWW40_000854 [Coemansia sp. RSA 1250]|nr:hypothetical protein IWW40_000854 [Coemansia sp. RSA 1250]
MALKAELEQWHQAVEYFDEQDYDLALDVFESIADSAKIHFNIGLILGRKLNHEGAIEAYTKALELDQYLVVAYFQRGVSYMVRQKNAEALADFNSALKYLRDNEFIDYTQIGLDYKVYTCEVMYNRALCFFCLGQEEDAQADLADASKRVAEERHSWIKRAIASNGMDCPLYCVPKGIIYRPSASKLKSTQKIDFLGSAKVIASADGKDNFTGFKGALVRKETLKSQGMSGGISHQKSMRVRKTTPPPDMFPGSGLARSNTMPINRHEPSSLPNRGEPRGQDPSFSTPPAATRMRSAGNIAGTNDQVRETPAAANVQQIDYGKGADDDVISTSSSAFSTPSATPTSGAPEMSPDHGNSQAASGPNKSAMKKPAKNGAVDPLDIIRAGLARRTTLKNQQRQQQQQQQQQRLNLPQRSATMKQMGTAGHADGSDGDERGPSNQSRLAGQLRSNLGAERRNNGASPGPPPGAQVARTEIIMPVIQRSNTDIALETSPTDYASSLSPEYHVGEQQQQQHQQPSAFNSAAVQHPGMAHVQSSTSPMMTPPLSYEEMAARGIAGISISQKPAVNAYGTSSSATISPSPASPAPGSHQYGSLNGAVAGGLRRAPTKKDSMKVKVHYNEAIINLMVPKMASYETLRAKISAKLASAMDEEQPSRSALRIQYLDEDGEAVLMTDEDDFELAKAYAGGDMSTPETNVVERLELWCST